MPNELQLLGFHAVMVMVELETPAQHNTYVVYLFTVHNACGEVTL